MKILWKMWSRVSIRYCNPVSQRSLINTEGIRTLDESDRVAELRYESGAIITYEEVASKDYWILIKVSIVESRETLLQWSP